MARRRIPQVVDAYLTIQDIAGSDLPPIAVDSAAWYAWLEAPTTRSFAFHSAVGSFTARRERQHGRWYWYGYQTQHGQLHKRYIGKPAEVTQARLLDVATMLHHAQQPPPRATSAQGAARPSPSTIVPDRSVENHPPTILTTKLYMPRTRFHLVSRPHLLERLQRGLNGKLTLISAPAGFGKTTLLTEWMQQVSHPVAWVSLDEQDADPVTFLAYVVAAFQTVAPAVGATTWARLHAPQPQPIESLISTLLNDLVALPQQHILVLDDFHMVHTPAIQQVITFLLDHLPPQLHLVIATRADPALPLARLRARNDLTEMRATDLQFTAEEAGAFLTEVMGLPLSTADVAALEARTEGWIAGLQFAALAMRDRTDVASFITAFAGTHRFVIDYLVDEVLTRQSQPLQTFLLQTAILDRLCASLCDAVVATDTEQVPDQATDVQPSASSQALLDALERANLFLISLDDARHWYRYHHLFSEVLRARLASSSSQATVAQLHRRAATWYAQHALYREAIHHVLAAHDWEWAADLIEQHGVSLGTSGHLSTILGWLDAFPQAFIRARPTLSIFHAFLLMATNQIDAAENRLQDAERAVETDTPAEQVRIIRGQVTEHRGTIARSLGDLTHCVALAHQALDLLPEPDPGARLHAAHAFLVSGDVTPAMEEVVAATVPPVRTLLNPSATLRSITLLARLQVLQGRLRAAAATFDEAVRVVDDQRDLRFLPSSLSYYVGLGDLQREWNNLQAADNLLAHGMEHVKGALTPDADWATLGYIARARVQQARGDTIGALATCEEFMDLARRRHFAAHLVTRAAAAHARIALAQGNLAGAMRWADTSDLHTEDDVWYPREEEYLTFARVRIAQTRVRASNAKPDLQDVLRLLDRLLHAAQADARIGSVIEMFILRALALQALGNLHGAVDVLEQALLLAEPEGYIRVFVDEGTPLADLLRLAHTRRSAAGYVERLLSAYTSENTDQHAPSAAMEPPSTPSSELLPLVEPLSNREVEVLRLIATGKSNAEIAHMLVIAVSTVKTHTNTIFGKLGVSSRTQAVARARELYLL